MTTKNFRDGVSQKNRLLRALEPDYVAVDEQSWSDLLNFAQQYSQQLKYYDESNQENGDWSSFFEGDVEQMVAYINNPESFAEDSNQLNKLSEPHLVLFFTFLQLLRYPQQQFRELTPRYVNYYYKDVLKLTEKESIPDRIHLVFGLESEETSHLIPQGTLLNAGQDSQGIDLNYAIDEEIVLNQAQVASIKTLSMEKMYIDLQSIHNSNDRTDADFEAVLRWAFGSPMRGDELPEFNENAVDISYLNNLYQEIKEQGIAEIAQDTKDYILQQLFFATIEDFKYCWSIHYREINQEDPGIEAPTQLQWNQVYQLIEKANRKKINSQRRDVLKQERENYGFQEMLNFALGTPNPGDSLPRVPSTFENLDDLYASLVSVPEEPVEENEPQVPQVHQVMQFDGENDYIEVPYSVALNPNQFTVSCWVKVTGGEGSYRSPITSRANGTGYVFYAGSNNKWQLWIGNDSSWQVVTGIDVVLNTWTHLSGTYDGNKLKLYINGELAAELITSFAVNTVYPLRIAGGRTESSNADYLLAGQISEVRIWNEPRTESEIRWYMHRRLTGQESGLVGYWALNEINGDTQQVLDLSNNNNHGIAHGATVVVDDSNLPVDFVVENEPEEDQKDAAVVEYINEELCLSVEDLRTIIRTQERADSTEAQWSEVYRLLEKAQTRKRNFTYPDLSTEEIVNIYETSIVDAQEEETAEFEKFKTFTTIPQNPKTTMGLAIASPLLFLKEGDRVITITLACEEGSLDINAISEIDQAIKPFSVHLSTPEKWLELNYTAVEFGAGDFILQPPLRTYTTEQISLSDTETWFDLANPSNQPFSDGDLDNFIVWNNGEVYKITRYMDDHRVVVEVVGRVAIDTANSEINLYHSSAISLNSLQFKITLDDQQPAIAPLLLDESPMAIDTPYPIVKILLKDVLREDSYEETVICYQQFRSIRLKKATIQIDVQDIQEFNLRNDDSLLDSNSPFEIFGNSPKVGTGFYFANPEISRKKLDSLTLHLDWMQLPDNFATHYQAYSDTGIFNNAIANDSFKAQLKLLNNRSWLNIEPPKSLFTQTGTTLTNPIQLDYPDLDLYGYLPNPDTQEINLEDPFDYSRYFKLELESPNFGQQLYPLVLTKVALATDEATRNLTVYPPYTPEIKSISLDYTASIEINLTISSDHPPVNQVFQLNSFGYRNIQNPDNKEEGDRGYYFLPQYEEEGALYIGIRNLHPPENLSFLFQMMSGGANTELPNPDIHWSYLSGDRWQDFSENQILADTTTGLVDAGIIRFSIPETATKENHLLPRGLHWLRATVTENSSAIPDILDIKTQAVSATFVNQGNAEDHLSKNLAAESIQGLVNRDPVIEQVLQPYSSFGGRSKENIRAFNTRISERLRHKQRAITAWDYERLVLERFPEIYKVKCVTSELGSTNPREAKVTVVVIPDIANTAPFYPLEPKAPLYLLKKIEAYLKSRTSPFINLVVKNPRYEKIKYRVVVRLRPGYEQGYYLQQLNEDLKRFLSPWAYEEQADLTFGSSIHSSSVVHFIDKRPYVDYVTNLKLIEQVVTESNYSGEYDISYQVNESQLAQVQHPDSILVSASEHIIDLVTTDQYEEENFEGIGYMIMGIDFVVT